MTRKDKIFALAKGFRGRSKNCWRLAINRVEKSLQVLRNLPAADTEHRSKRCGSSKKSAVRCVASRARCCASAAHSAGFTGPAGALPCLAWGGAFLP